MNLNQLIKMKHFDLAATIQQIQGEHSHFSKKKSIDLYNLFLFIINEKVGSLTRAFNKKPYRYFTKQLPLLQSMMITLSDWQNKPGCNITKNELQRLKINFANLQIQLAMRILRSEKYNKKIKHNQEALANLIHILRHDFIWESEWTHQVSFDDYLTALQTIIVILGEQQPADIDNQKALVGLMTDWIKIESPELTLQHHGTMLKSMNQLRKTFTENHDVTTLLDLYASYFGVALRRHEITQGINKVHQKVLYEVEKILDGTTQPPIETHLLVCYRIYDFYRVCGNHDIAASYGRRIIALNEMNEDVDLKLVYENEIHSIKSYLEDETHFPLSLFDSNPDSNPFELISTDSINSVHRIHDSRSAIPVKTPSSEPESEQPASPDVSSSVNGVAEREYAALEQHKDTLPIQETPMPLKRPTYLLAINPQKALIKAIISDWDGTLVDMTNSRGEKIPTVINESTFTLFGIARNLGIELAILTSRAKTMEERRAVIIENPSTKHRNILRYAHANSTIPNILNKNHWQWIFTPSDIIYCDLYKRSSTDSTIYCSTLTMDTHKTKRDNFLSFCASKQIPSQHVALFDDDPFIIRDIPSDTLKIIVPGTEDPNTDRIARKFTVFDETVSILIQITLFNQSLPLEQRATAASELLKLSHQFSDAMKNTYLHDLELFLDQMNIARSEASPQRRVYAEKKRSVESSEDSAAKRVKISTHVGMFSNSSTDKPHYRHEKKHHRR